MKEILYVESNKGDIELLREALQEIKANASLLTMQSSSEAHHYLGVRFSTEGVPPPHTVLIALTPHDSARITLVDFLRAHAVLDSVSVVLLGILSPDDALASMAAMFNIAIIARPDEWDDVLDLARAISS